MRHADQSYHRNRAAEERALAGAAASKAAAERHREMAERYDELVTNPVSGEGDDE